jgi:hypothetical protein
MKVAVSIYLSIFLIATNKLTAAVFNQTHHIPTYLTLEKATGYYRI